MRCRNAYLGWRELPAAVGLLGSEGQLGKVSGWPKKANTARPRANSSISNDYQLSNLESLTAGVRYGLLKFHVPKVCSERWV